MELENYFDFLSDEDIRIKGTGQTISWISLLLAACILGLFFSCSSMPLFAETTKIHLEIEIGVQKDGALSSKWLTAIKGRHSTDEFNRLKSEKQKLSPVERQWISLFQKEIPGWKTRLDLLGVPFQSISPPKKVTIILANRGGEDGFTYSSTTIGIDVSAWYRNYGNSSLKQNKDRIHRILSHEYTHLLTTLWLKVHPVKLNTPLDRALLEIFYEGLGNYRSLSKKWYSDNGELSELAQTTLKRLAPIFVDRLVKLSRTTDPVQERNLLKGLSKGPFREKWGALTAALWFAAEAKGDDKNLQKWVKKGPQGILELADRYLPPSLREKL